VHKWQPIQKLLMTTLALSRIQAIDSHGQAFMHHASSHADTCTGHSSLLIEHVDGVSGSSRAQTSGLDPGTGQFTLHAASALVRARWSALSSLRTPVNDHPHDRPADAVSVPSIWTAGYLPLDRVCARRVAPATTATACLHRPLRDVE